MTFTTPNPTPTMLIPERVAHQIHLVTSGAGVSLGTGFLFAAAVFVVGIMLHSLVSRRRSKSSSRSGGYGYYGKR